MLTSAEYEIVENILDNFDFRRVHSVMEFLDWKHYTEEDGCVIPDLLHLRKSASRLLHNCVKLMKAGNHEAYNIATGGFYVYGNYYDGQLTLRLMFSVEEQDNYD